MAQGGILIEGVDFTRAGGTYTFAPEWEGREVQVEYQVLEAAAAQSALGQLGLNLATGALAQPTWAHLTSNHAAQAIGYSGLAYLYAPAYDLGDSAALENHNFEVSTPSEFSASVVDADMSRVVAEFLTDGVRGCQWPASKLADTSAYSNYCRSHGLFMSPELVEQTQAAEVLANWLRLTNSSVVWSALQLKIVPLGDEARTANGATYTPVTTPVRDFTVGDYIHAPGSPRVKVSPRPNEDASNIIRVEFKNRANDYALEIAEARDQAHIELYGERVGEVIRAHEIKLPAVAAFVAQMELQRQMAVWNDYTFTVGWMHARLEPLDLLTLTEPDQYLDRAPVRITRINEVGEDAFEVICEDAPIGVASAPQYGAQAGTGYKPDFNAAPGNVDAPVVFELPQELAGETGLQLAVAVRGSSAAWGGCRVWVSLDGSNYREMGTQYGGARYGTLAGTMAETVPVNGLGSGQLLSGTAADAAARQTMCYVGGSVPEFFGYQAATLTGAGAYTLDGLVRGAYGTPRSAHLAGAPFVRFDSAIVRSEPLPVSLIGSTVHLKFTSFNSVGLAEQSLADVAAYTYTVTGFMRSVAAIEFDTWTLNGQVLDVVGSGKVGPRVLALDSTGGYPNAGRLTPIDRSKVYRVRFWARPTSTCDGLLYFSLRQFTDAAGTPGPDNGGRDPYKPSARSRAQHITEFGDTWGEYSFLWQPDDWQAGAAFMQPEFLNSYGGTAGRWEIQDFRFSEVTELTEATTAAADAASDAADAQAALVAIVSDSVLSRAEKPGLIQDWTVIVAEQAGLMARAAAFGITTEADALEVAYLGTSSYLGGLTPAWNDLGVDSPVVGATLRASFASYYAARQTLMNKLLEVAALRASWANVTGKTVVTSEMAVDATTEIVDFYDADGIAYSTIA